MTVAALYIDPRGPYPKIAGVDCWDETRDARKYDGPWPVVAHPACGPWGSFVRVYRGGEGGPELAVIAVERVRANGGVLEHPRASKLWLAADLPKPGELPDAFGGYTISVNQSDWGHACRKPTWLYLVGVPREALEDPPFPGRKPTHWIGSTNRGGDLSRGRRPPGVRAAHKAMRVRTPVLFAEYLVRLARSVAKVRAA